jgi:hypothetical protein
MSDEQPEVFAEIRVPEGWAQGVYANGISTWFVETDITLDFFINLQPDVTTDESGKTTIVVPQQIVARLKVAPSMATYMSLQIAEAVRQYEERYGKIEQLKDQPPLFPESLDDQGGSNSA